MSNLDLRIGFSGFWKGFSPKSFFLPLVEHATGRTAHEATSSRPDLVFESVFFSRPRFFRLLQSKEVRTAILLGQARPKRGEDIPRIWFTGENIRPPISGYDLSLSFDTDDFGGSNLYFPLIFLGIDWFESAESRSSLEIARSGLAPKPSDLVKRRHSDVAERPYFACAFVGNPEPTRLRVIEALSSIGQVDVFGPAVGRPLKHKAEVARQYRFMLCFENDLYPGYVTEKALDAWAAGCIPLWWGIDKARLFNKNAVVNLYDFESLGSFVDYVRALDRDRSTLAQIAEEPLFRSTPGLVEITSRLANLLSR